MNDRCEKLLLKRREGHRCPPDDKHWVQRPPSLENKSRLHRNEYFRGQ
jgi:hypothetical protein